MNRGMSTILPPDENTLEMAVDCPGHTPDSNGFHNNGGTSTPQVVEDDPPPTPLDASSVISMQTRKATKNLEEAAEVAAGLPQPEMDLTRIHRLRESVRRQKKMEAENRKIQEMMTKDEGAQKLERLRSGQRHKTKPKSYGDGGKDNLAYAHDEGQADEEPPTSVEQGIEEMLMSLNHIGQHIGDEGLIDDMIFVKKLVQDDSFQRALSMHHTLISSTSSSSSNNKSLPLCPETLYLKTIASDVHEELNFCHLEAATELNEILRKPTVQAMMETHDSVAQTTVSASEKMSFLLDIHPPLLLPPHPHAAAHTLTTPVFLPEHEEIVARASQLTDKQVRVVTINKTADALGATVRCEADGSVTIGRIVSGGAAEMSGLMREGDEVLEVNGKPVRGLDVNQVGDMIAAMKGQLTFALASHSSHIHTPLPQSINEPPNSVKTVRALFDYDSYDDPYLPCRELGLSFVKGEILRIMSTDDSNWWQAHRDSDDDTHLTLAGLIPSHDFHHRRETLRMAISRENVAASDMETAETSSLFCGPRRKKKTKTPATPVIEDEQVQTYEDMALYHQTEAKKRPIVLIGPPNVGRPELRQRLMDNDRDRFALPIPHTTKALKAGETDGVEYKHVSKEEFEAMGDAFVEIGSFQKELYGTSIQAVDDLINSGKICVLNLHATTLPRVSNTGLMPYIVFISPPPLEKLRTNMARERKQLKEDELREIIDKAREMEANYAQFFDETIRNVDLDRSYAELLRLINKLDTEPQWVPARWLD